MMVMTINKRKNFAIKVDNLKTKLAAWRPRTCKLTLFGRCLIVTLGLSQIVYSAFILYTPNKYASVIQSLLFQIKRQGSYHDYGDGAVVFGSLTLKCVEVPALSVDLASPQKS